jgi:hypothetical protein
VLPAGIEPATPASEAGVLSAGPRKRAPGWIRTTVSEEPGLQPGAIDRSATDASWGGWRDSNPAWTGVTARCFGPSASSSVRDDGLEPPACPVWTGCSAAELIARARPRQESNLHRQLRRLLACPLATGTRYPLQVLTPGPPASRAGALALRSRERTRTSLDDEAIILACAAQESNSASPAYQAGLVNQASRDQRMRRESDSQGGLRRSSGFKPGAVASRLAHPKRRDRESNPEGSSCCCSGLAGGRCWIRTSARLAP